MQGRSQGVNGAAAPAPERQASDRRARNPCPENNNTIHKIIYIVRSALLDVKTNSTIRPILAFVAMIDIY